MRNMAPGGGSQMLLYARGIPMRNAIDIHEVELITRLWSYRVYHKDVCERRNGTERGWTYLSGAE